MSVNSTTIQGMYLPEPIGGAWLAARFGVAPLGRLPVLSQIGGRRSTREEDGTRVETHVEQMRPADTLVAHLQFHLRHETIHLELLSRLFATVGPDAVQAWVNDEPTGQYARRAAFLYEWLTGQELAPPAGLGGNYVDAIDPDKLVSASPDHAERNAKWRVRDNLPGTPAFCPILPRGRAFDTASALDVSSLIKQLSDEFGEDLLMRAATWMTVRESKASFTIEGEANQTTRIQRFADVITRMTGQGSVPLDGDSLAELQEQILGANHTLRKLGLRESPVFVGESVRGQERVHYIAPPSVELEAMLNGLRTFLDRTQGQSAVMRATIAAFGFVYIHPMADGNGRVHRFLINDILRRDGVLAEPLIVPVSAVITSDASQKREYDRTLDQVSVPLMKAVWDLIEFESTHTTYPDGVVSNVRFEGNDLARPLWRYPDLTPHVVYLSQIIRRTIVEEMREESRYLRMHHRSRQALKEVVEMPDPQADRVLRSMDQNDGKLSNVLAKEMPILTKEGIWDAIVDAVSQARLPEEQPDLLMTARYRPQG